MPLRSKTKTSLATREAVPGRDRAYRFGIVFESIVGHVTFARTLRAAVDDANDIDAAWHPLGPAPNGVVERLPWLTSNWSVRAGARARAVLARHPHAYDALLFHAQTASLMSVAVMRATPSVVSTDATPRNFDQVAWGYQHRVAPAAVEVLKRQVVRRPLQAAYALIAWSNWVRSSLVEDYAVDPRRIEVIPPGTTIGTVSPRPKERRPGPPRVLFVGGDFERKGGPLLIRAVERLGTECELHLVTKGHVPVRRNVVVYSDLEPGSATLGRLYADADVFALPTLADAFGHVLIEAMAAELPVITTPVGAIPEVVRDQDTALLVTPNDEDELTTALERLTGDLELARRMGERGRRVAVREYDARVNAKRVLAVLRRAAASRACS